ncbi:MAG TPA: histidine--tRNA ligase, partial [Thermoleophilaceae bacterium]|nr:histidine--tRNA ligase [Thermoleophilaceae bacterium]
MSDRKLQAPRGTFDVLPEDGQRRRELYRRAGSVLGRYGYRPFETPVFEDTELFARGVGESTDIVRKEMFTFEDRGGRSLTLRPEGTAGVARAYVEHGMHKLPQPVKLWYWGPFFRHERAQAGRYRQFAQVGVEALGSDDPSLDAEAVLLLAELLEAAGVHEIRLRLSSLGSPDARAAYLDGLRRYLRDHEGELSDDVRGRIDANPLRAFDADHEGTRAVMANAPRLLDSLTGDDAEHFAEVCALLNDAGVSYDVDATLVRGLDYYTRTTWEFIGPLDGANSTISGGGRYDGLIEEIGGPPTPGVGFGAGIERLLLALEDAGVTAEPSAPDVFIAVEPDAPRELALGWLKELRAAGVAADTDYAGRSLKGQLTQAGRSGAHTIVIVRSSEAVVRRQGAQDEPLAHADVLGTLL